MKWIKSWFVDEEKREVLLLVISAIALGWSLLGKGGLPFDPAWAAVALCGIPIVWEAGEGLFTRLDVKADLLVAIALIAAAATGEIFAAGEVAVIMALGEMLEERTLRKARMGMEKLLHLLPLEARILEKGSERMISADEVVRGQRIRVLGGETIPADGVIFAGSSSVDQSVMTGESIPVDKVPGDEVSAGFINQYGVLEIDVTCDAGDSTFRRMIRLVESADAGKAKIVSAADRWATWIVLAALATALGVWVFSGEAIRAVAILVVFCPCALVLATPTAIMAGIANAAKHGILIREGDALERLSQVTAVAFDKTGTLTHGKPEVVEVFVEDEPNREKFLHIVASGETASEHPLGRAVALYAQKNGLTDLSSVSNFTLTPGRGIRADVAACELWAGNEAWMREKGQLMSDGMAERSKLASRRGATVIYGAWGGVVNGFFALADTLRSSGKPMVRELHQLGLACHLLSGDQRHAVDGIAEEVGIKQVHAECLPADKMAYIADQQQSGEKICMVGDGVNDAPALKAAHVGIAMGGIGSDIAMEAADVVFVRDNLAALPHLMKLAKRTMNTIHWNIILSLLLNFVAIGFAAAGLLPPVWGALVHNLGALAVIANSIRLLRYAPSVAESH